LSEVDDEHTIADTSIGILGLDRADHRPVLTPTTREPRGEAIARKLRNHYK